MFGGALVKKLAGVQGHTIRAMARSLDKARKQGLGQLKNVEPVFGDLKEPKSLSSALEGVDRVFLVTPMAADLDQMEMNLIKAAKQHGVRQIFKLYGAVKHGGDYLIQMHDRGLQALKKSGMEWTLISPNSVMETSLLPFKETISQENAIYGCTGHHKVGMVALDDVVEAAAKTLATPGHAGMDYQLTGPESLSLYEIAERFSTVLHAKIHYRDMTEQEFEEMLVEALGKTREEIELEVMCHMRAWNRDGADLVTDTFEKITGRKPTSVAEWIAQHADAFKVKVS